MCDQAMDRQGFANRWEHELGWDEFDVRDDPLHPPGGRFGVKFFIPLNDFQRAKNEDMEWRAKFQDMGYGFGSGMMTYKGKYFSWKDQAAIRQACMDIYQEKK